MQAQFAGRLVNQRDLCAPKLRDPLARLFVLRQIADDKPELVFEIQAARALRRDREFVDAVGHGGAENP